MKTKQLPEDYAIVLQQISEDGGDELDDLLDSLRIDRTRLQHIIRSLHHKGLITIEAMGYDTWLSLSSKGRHLIRYLWPESGLSYGY
jgi:DNA-binding MarR family transcriptional regulator